MAVLIPNPAFCQMEWRVSVKFIVDSDGDRPLNGVLSTDADVRNQFNVANATLAQLGRGYRFQLTEITNLVNDPYVTNFFKADSTDQHTASVLGRIAATNQFLFRWREDAINIYINAFNGAAVCSISGTGPGTNDIILAGQQVVPTTLFHEAGHYFTLFHTQGRSCAGCTGPNACVVPGDDEIADTLPAVACWSQDQIATNYFGLHYAELSLAQQVQVDMTYLNVMSYRISGRTALTPDQLDRVTDVSNGSRIAIATGRTQFVATTGNDTSGTGASDFPYRTLARGVAQANSGEIVLLRGGSYNEPQIITKNVTLRASRGGVTVGQ